MQLEIGNLYESKTGNLIVIYEELPLKDMTLYLGAFIRPREMKILYYYPDGTHTGLHGPLDTPVISWDLVRPIKFKPIEDDNISCLINNLERIKKLLENQTRGEI